MNVAVCFATYGDPSWSRMAAENALPSALEAGFERIVFEHLEDGTLAEARNRAAWRAATSGPSPEWLCFLDADDRLHPGFLDGMQRMHGVFSDIDEALYAPAVSYVTADGGRTPALIPNAGRWPQMNECVIGTLVRARLFEQVGGFHEWPCYEDWDLWLRCVKAGARIVYVPEAVYLATSPGARNIAADVCGKAYHDIWEANQ